MTVKVKNSKNKVRVNITVDKKLLKKAKGKLDMFGGKLSTLFNAYLADFVKSIDKVPGRDREGMIKRKLEEIVFSLGGILQWEIRRQSQSLQSCQMEQSALMGHVSGHRFHQMGGSLLMRQTVRRR